MSNYYPLQQSFNGGELTPRLYGNANTERYGKSLESMTNFIALPQGPAMRRQGFAYVSQALNNKDIRLLPFKVPGSTDYVVELGPGYIGLLSRDASRQDPTEGGRQSFSTDELIGNGDFKEGILHWTESFSDSSAYFTTVRDKKRVQVLASGGSAANYSSSAVSQVISMGGASGDIELSFSWGALLSVSTDNPTSHSLASCNVRVGTAAGLGDLYSGSFDPETDSASVIDGPSNGAWDTQAAVEGGTNADWDFGINSENITVNVGVNDPVYITLEVIKNSPKIPGNSGVFNTGQAFDSTGTVFGFFEDISFSSDVVVSDTFTTPWLTEADLAIVQYVSESGGNRMYFTHPSYEPYLLELENGSWSFGPITITSKPAVWSGDNWPSVCEFFQGRLWLAATPGEASTIWASVAGDPFDFTTGTNDDDSLELPLSTTGGIKWIKGQKGLVVGTDIGEQLISSVGSYITPTDRKAEKQSGWGSVDIQPSLAGNDIVYVSQDRTKVRAINSYFNTASWASVDLTWVAEHITRNRIIETIYIQNPNYQLYFLLGDGTIVACTYDREHETVGWMNMVTSGRFVSMTKTDSVEGTILWVGVRRNGNIYIEAIDPDESAWQFTDSWLKRNINSNIVDGLDHLEGLTVQILVDGAIEPDQVVSGGQITTEQDGSFAVVGVKYTAEMTTLPLGGGNPAGTALGSKRRMARIFVQLYDSALPLINGVLPPDRDPATPMDTVQPNKTGVAEARSLGRDNGGRVIITQDLPKKTMVTAIFGKASTENT
jgi:hypothetical protein